MGGEGDVSAERSERGKKKKKKKKKEERKRKKERGGRELSKLICFLFVVFKCIIYKYTYFLGRQPHPR